MDARPTDPLLAASAYIAVPYRRHGASEAGWDCLGLVKVLAPKLFGWEPPYGVGFYSRADMDDPDRRDALLRDGASAWRPCAARAGCVALFHDLGRANHVGLMLTAKTFIHARDEATGTVIEDMNRAWARKLVGYFECA